MPNLTNEEKLIHKTLLDNGLKLCRRCQEVLPIESFPKAEKKGSKDGLHGWCKNCNQWRRYKNFLRLHYNLSLNDLEKLKLIQDNKCAICKIEKELFVDHLHETDIVRGLLCRECNCALGLFDDNVEFLAEAINYLKKAG